MAAPGTKGKVCKTELPTLMKSVLLESASNVTESLWLESVLIAAAVLVTATSKGKTVGLPTVMLIS